MQGPSIIHVNPLLNNSAAQASMQPAIDFVNARNGSVVIEELPSYLGFFNKYVTAAQAVRIASLHIDGIHSIACFRLSAPNSTLAPVSSLPLSSRLTPAARNYHR